VLTPTLINFLTDSGQEFHFFNPVVGREFVALIIVEATHCSTWGSYENFGSTRAKFKQQVPGRTLAIWTEKGITPCHSVC
jgi:hypothetical protein